MLTMLVPSFSLSIWQMDQIGSITFVITMCKNRIDFISNHVVVRIELSLNDLITTIMFNICVEMLNLD